MRVYVAARFAERATVRGIYDELRRHGHSPTLDWTVHADVLPYAEHAELATGYAGADLDGVCDSDAFILLTSGTPGTGSTTEFGAALAAHRLRGRPLVYVIGDHISTNLFHFHPAVKRFPGLPEVLAELARIDRTGR